MKIIITGSEGFIGKELVKALYNHTLYCFDRKIGKEAIDCIPLIKDVDVIIHLAAQTSVFNTDIKQIQKDNIDLFIDIALECNKYNKKLIYASSSTANNSNITSMYGLSKQFNEQFAKIYCPNSVGLRFHNVWSFTPREGTLMWHLLNDKCVSLYNNGNNVRCFTYIDDIITGIIKSFTLTESVYNIVNNEPISTLEFANIVKQKFDIHYKCIPDIRPLDKINQFVNTDIPTIDIKYHKVNEIIKKRG